MHNTNCPIVRSVALYRLVILSLPNEINFMIIYLFSQKIYSFTAVLNLFQIENCQIVELYVDKYTRMTAP